MTFLYMNPPIDRTETITLLNYKDPGNVENHDVRPMCTDRYILYEMYQYFASFNISAKLKTLFLKVSIHFHFIDQMKLN